MRKRVFLWGLVLVAVFLILPILLVRKILATESVFPPQGVIPIVYKMFGLASDSFPENAGAVGTWKDFAWSSIEPRPSAFNWGPIESYLNSFRGKKVRLKNGQEVQRPVGIMISSLVGDCNSGSSDNRGPKECQGLLIPPWLIDEIGEANIPLSAPQPQPQCGKAYYPPWNNPTFQRRWAEMVAEFGKKYDGDPRVNWIGISTGAYGEAIETMYNNRQYNSNSCPRFEVGSGLVNWAVGNPRSDELYRRGVIHIFRQAFKKTPLFIINTGYRARMDLARRALQVSPHVGIRMLSWHPDLPEENLLDSHVNTFKWYWENCGSDCLTGWEHFYASNRPQTYWAILFALSHGTTFVDFSQDHVRALAEVENCGFYQQDSSDCYPLWEMTEGHLGRNVYSVPDVFIVLRDTFYQVDDGRKGETGNWERYLSLIDGNEFPSVSCRSLSLPFNQVNPNRIYGCWDSYDRKVARRTDQAVGRNYMQFVVDNRWPAKQTSGFDIEVTYIDFGNDSFALEYKDTVGGLRREVVQKNNTSKFIRKRFILTDLSLNKPIGSTDNLRINSNGDGDEYIHLVRVIPKNWLAPVWDFSGQPYLSPTPTVTVIPSSTPAPTVGGGATATPILVPLSEFKAGWNYLTWQRNWSDQYELGSLPLSCPTASYFKDNWFYTFVRGYSQPENFLAGQSYFVYCFGDVYWGMR